MKKLINILSGCKNHPGNFLLAMFVCIGAVAGLRGGLLGVLFGVGVMVLGLGPIYLIGAYDRAKIYISKKDN